MLLPVWLSAQQFESCPVDHHYTEVYKNPLFDDYLSKYDVKFYHISLEVSNVSTWIEGFTTVQVEALDEMDTIVFQLLDPMEITGIEADGIENSGYIHRNDAVYIPVSQSRGSTFSVTVYYKGDAGQNRGFFAGITSAYDNTNKQYVTYTLSEPLNARDWFPVKQVLTDKADSVWVDLTCDKGLLAGSNGLLREIEDLPGGKHKLKWRSYYPIAYYLISFAVADYRDYSFYAPLSGPDDSVLVQNFIYDDDEYFSNWKSRIDATGDMITLFSELVTDYPFSKEKYGHSVAPLGGGMEHQTMTTLSNFNFTLVAHELAHMWFGDNVTCGTWQDIWINEGFASYFEYLALDALYGKQNASDWMEYAMNTALQENGSVYVPLEDAENEFRVFDYGLSYKKGAVLLHMIRYVLDNDGQFFGVLKSYSEKFTGKHATAAQFREVLDSISGIDFSCFFDQWYYGKGHPVFYLSWTSKNDTLYIQSLQESSSEETPLFRTPFDLEIQTMDGDQRIRLYQDRNEQLFTIPFASYITKIVFDPDKKLLAKGSVISKRAFENKIVVGPNPFQESLMLSFFQSSDFDTLRVLDMNGKLLLSREIDSNPLQLDLGFLPDGPYLLVVEGELGSYREKIIKAGSL